MKDGKAYFTQQEEEISNKYMNANGQGEYSNFMGTGISTFKIIWWGLGAFVLLVVISKGTKVYKEIKG
jgi:hypothetical protein|tara:strand:- start:190 stop:393 length:204 start_codon:yes stop_codon:yes gene_type:complete